MTSDIVQRLNTALDGRYRIERALGAGGMATVYLADDLKHDRKVALKVLKPELAAVLGAERFVVEIKTTAALQHPHILPLFDSGTADGFLYYVMPFIDGETLRSKLDRETQLGVDEAVKIATDVASALHYAHQHGVIHRDIKPENILLHDGRPMVADFGIALAVSAAAGGRMTETGLSLGTPHYMSPEQATAEKEITARSDVYSLASVLYEMLAGEPPHMGNSAQQIIMKIITEPAQAVTKLRRTVPEHVAAALAKALEKLPADRFESAKGFADALGNTSFTTSLGAAAGAQRSGVRHWIRDRRTMALGAVAIVALGAAVAARMSRTDDDGAGAGRVVYASLSLGARAEVRPIASMRLAIDRAGRRIVFVGPDGDQNQLWVREFDQDAARPLPNTRGAISPFFSPDGESIGFFSGSATRASLRIVPVSGGAARVVVADSVAGYGGGSWGDDGNIYFTRYDRGIGRVSLADGTVTKVSAPDSASGISEHDFPDVVPGGRFAVVTLWKGSVGSSRVGLVNLATGAVTDLALGSMGRFVAPNFIAIASSRQVQVARLNLRKGVLESAPVPVPQQVQGEPTNGTVQFAASRNGTLVYQNSTDGVDGLVWVERDGRQSLVDSTMHGAFPGLALSPDGRQIAVTTLVAGESQVWVKQLSTGSFSRLSLDVTDADRPTWTADGRNVAFLGNRNGRRTSWMRRADGSDATSQPAAPGNGALDEIGFDPHGRYTVLRSFGSAAGTRQLSVLEYGKDTLPRPILPTKFDQYGAVFSPDGKWLAYVSEESGIPEVYVRPFPNVDSARFAISIGGGQEPMWRVGTELTFRGARGEMYATPVTIGPRFTYGTPKKLFDNQSLVGDNYHHAYDVTPDGKRFLMVSSGGSATKELNVIFNWRLELNRLTATAK